jgi:hypothetical protein
MSLVRTLETLRAGGADDFGHGATGKNDSTSRSQRGSRSPQLMLDWAQAAIGTDTGSI